MTDSVKTDKQLEQEKSNRIMSGVATWASYYRSNPKLLTKLYLQNEYVA